MSAQLVCVVLVFFVLMLNYLNSYFVKILFVFFVSLTSKSTNMKRLVLNFFLWLFHIDYRFCWIMKPDGNRYFIPMRIVSVPDLKF